MERALALQALMREYGHDRQICSQLLKGIERKQDRKKIQEDVLTFWLNHLQKHLEEEEDVLIPFLARNQFDNRFLRLMQRENDTIRLLAQRLPMHDDGYYLYEVFVNLVSQHIAFKEDVVLQKVEEEIPANELAQLNFR